MTLRGARRRRGAAARLSGRRAEILCALWLILKGYRVLGLRLPTPYGEIDLLVRKGPVLAVIEVKRRTSLEAALEAVGRHQRDRLRRAAVAMAGRGGHPPASQLRLDLIALAPGRWPRHIPDAWRDG